MMMTEDEICLSFKNAVRPRSQVKILSQLNACTEQEIQAILGARGVQTPPRRRRMTPRHIRWTPELRAEAVRLIFEEGMPLQDAANHFGCSLPAIRNLLVRMGLSTSKAARSGSPWHKFRDHMNQTGRKAGKCIGKDELCD